MPPSYPATRCTDPVALRNETVWELSEQHKLHTYIQCHTYNVLHTMSYLQCHKSNVIHTYIHTCMYMYVCMYVCMYIYIFIPYLSVYHLVFYVIHYYVIKLGGSLNRSSVSLNRSYTWRHILVHHLVGHYHDVTMTYCLLTLLDDITFHS